MTRKHNDLEINQEVTSLFIFMESYNKSLPEGFPRATAKSLEQFQTIYPSLFKRRNEWSIDKHRKKLMDWLISHHENS